MIHAYHLVARALPLQTPLTERESCVDLWRRLRLRFPDSAACVLMPNHLHLLTWTARPKVAMQNLATEVRAWTQRFHPNTKIWSKVPPPVLIPDRHHLMRQIRYVHLNPCRAGLATDPLSWEWSTHRDFTGCVISPWPPISRLAAEFKVDRHRFGNWIHAYASKDPSVAIAGTAPILEYKKGEPLRTATAHVWAASAIALREISKNQRGPVRRLTIQTCGFLQLPQDPEYLKISLRHLKLMQQGLSDLGAIQRVLKILLDPRTRPSVH